MNTKTLEFINKSSIIHNNKYDYSKVDYVNSKTKIIIICKEHGEFKQIPNSHLKGANCKICGYKNRIVNKTNLTNNDFINKAKIIHGERYDYSKVNYINSYSKIMIICKEHGIFTQIANKHLTGSNCIKCNRKSKFTTSDFINKSRIIHGNNYDYSKVNFIDKESKIIIICKKHGEFLQKPISHLNNKICRKCFIANRTFSINEFIQKANITHDFIYDYSKVNYINSHVKVIIICKKHKEFEQLPLNHINGQGCPFCKNKTEGMLFLKLKKVYRDIKCQFKADWCKNIYHLPFDFLIPEYNIIIELDGKQHFEQVASWE